MKSSLLHLLILLSVAYVATGSAWAQSQEKRVAEYLQAHQMHELLEVHLRVQIDQARTDEQRDGARDELGSFYLEQIRAEPVDSVRRQRLLARAWDLASSAGDDQLIGLRVELLINRYLPIERTVELHLILLDDPSERVRSISQLIDIQRRFVRVETLMRADARAIERRLKTFRRDDETEQLSADLDQARRNLSLSRYYIGWCGYSLSVLDDRDASNEAMEAFGWLLGAKGEVPTLEHLKHAVIEFDHVARAAIGVALCKARNGDMITARQWLRHVLDLDTVNPETVENARTRLLQIESADARWASVAELIDEIHDRRNGPMRVDESRYVAISVLTRGHESRRSDPQADQVAQLALEDLIKLGEIGHILDLHARFGSLPLMGDRFLSQYASALMALDEAERPEVGGLFATAANMFSRALNAEDIDQFPDEAGDCALKLAYCLIRSERPRDALDACDSLLEFDPNDQIVEQARWLRIASIEMLHAAGQTQAEELLEDAVTEYIISYPDSANAATLLIQHGVYGDIEPSLAIHALMSMPEDDPAAIPARRLLIHLYHKQFLASRRTDLIAKEKAIDLVIWLWESSSEEPADLSEARNRLSIIRMILDFTRSSAGEDNEIIARAVLRGILLIDTNPPLMQHRDELLLRRIEFLISQNELARAEKQILQMSDPDASFAIAATRMVFAAALNAWDAGADPSVNADRIISLGAVLIEATLPTAPEVLSGQESAIVSAVARAAEFRGSEVKDPASIALSFRLCKLLLARGRITDEILHLTARLAAQQQDQESELAAWLELLSRALPSEPAWFEARYESFRILLGTDPERARKAIDQYRVLHPNPAPEPWTAKLQLLVDGRQAGGTDG